MSAKERRIVAAGATGRSRGLQTAGLRGAGGTLLALLVAVFLAAEGPASAADEESYKVVQGLGVYLGVLPAAMVRGHPAGHPEATMHGRAPRGAHEYHLIIAVFDDATGARIENARVTANVSGLGHVGGRSFTLEPMTIAGTVTYGNFINLPGNAATTSASTSRFRAGKSPRGSTSPINMFGEPGREDPMRLWVTVSSTHQRHRFDVA